MTLGIGKDTITDIPRLYSKLRKNMTSVRDFTADSRRLIYLELKKQAVENSGQSFSKPEQKEYEQLKTSVENSKMFKYQNSGFIQSIANDILDDEVTKNSMLGNFASSSLDKLTDKINKIFKTNINPERAKHIASELYITPESKIGRTVGDFIKNTDYVFRISLYEMLIEKGYSQREAEKMVLTGFVDYRKTLQSEIKILDEYGFIPFAGWLLRMQYPIYSNIKRNPVLGVASLMAATIGVTDSIAGLSTLSWNPMSAFAWNGIGDTNPYGSAAFGWNAIVPTFHEDLYDVVTGDLERATRLGGFTLS
jgi:hypothetical protein